MKVLDEANVQLKAGKCIIAQMRIEWLGSQLSRTGISFLVAVNQFTNFIPNLTAISYPIRDILEKNADWKQNTEHEIHLPKQLKKSNML